MKTTKIMLTLEDHRIKQLEKDHFKVRKITNSIEWKIWQFLSEYEVQQILSNRKDVDIQIVEPNFA